MQHEKKCLSLFTSEVIITRRKLLRIYHKEFLIIVVCTRIDIFLSFPNGCASILSSMPLALYLSQSPYSVCSLFSSPSPLSLSRTIFLYILCILFTNVLISAPFNSFYNWKHFFWYLPFRKKIVCLFMSFYTKVKQQN